MITKNVFNYNDKESSLNQRGCRHIILNILAAFWTVTTPWLLSFLSFLHMTPLSSRTFFVPSSIWQVNEQRCRKVNKVPSFIVSD